MKHVLSKALIASGLLLGSSIVSVGYAASEGLPRPDIAKGEELYVNGDLNRGIIACMTCHGDAGNSTIPVNPSLAGQPYQYLLKQLTDFKSKDDAAPARGGPGGAPSVMGPMVVSMTQDDMQNVALFLSHQVVDPEAAATATQEATMERGQQIWRAGLPDRRVPACAACHAPNGAGIPGDYPRLAGQHPSYLAEQLNMFRSGDRANSPMMHDVADRMTDADIAAVADYAAGLR